MGDYFNPRSRVGNDRCRDSHTTYFPDFNPRSRVGNDVHQTEPVRISLISIHVPAWGTTSANSASPSYPLFISIHVPAWGTTAGALPVSYHSQDFNPRSRVGNDPDRRSQWLSVMISIHVPAWGTTRNFCLSFWMKLFQSTFPRGERPGNRVTLTFSYRISIHVPAWGTTAGALPVSYHSQDFNPRSRVGNDE